MQNESKAAMTQHPVTPQEAREALASLRSMANAGVLQRDYSKLEAFIAQQSPAAQGGAQQSEGENENAVERGGRHPVSIHEAIDVLRAVERDWVHPYDDAPFEDGEMPTMDRVRRLVKEDALFRVLLGIGA